MKVDISTRTKIRKLREVITERLKVRGILDKRDRKDQIAICKCIAHLVLILIIYNMINQFTSCKYWQ